MFTRHGPTIHPPVSLFRQEDWDMLSMQDRAVIDHVHVTYLGHESCVKNRTDFIGPGCPWLPETLQLADQSDRHIHPEGGVRQIGWIGQSGRIYRLGQSVHEHGGFQPIYVEGEADCGHAVGVVVGLDLRGTHWACQECPRFGEGEAPEVCACGSEGACTFYPASTE